MGPNSLTLLLSGRVYICASRNIYTYFSVDSCLHSLLKDALFSLNDKLIQQKWMPLSHSVYWLNLRYVPPYGSAIFCNPPTGGHFRCDPLCHITSYLCKSCTYICVPVEIFLLKSKRKSFNNSFFKVSDFLDFDTLNRC